MEDKDELAFLEEMSDEDLIAWMRNFNEKLPGVLAELGMSPSLADGPREAAQRFEEAAFEDSLANPTSPLQVQPIKDR